MKHLTAILIILVMSIFGRAGGAVDYYVSVSGNNDYDGLSEDNAWRTISYSTGKVSQGDTVYVKAGNYGAENVVFTVDGTSGSPIIYEGYTSSPGDNPDLGWSYPDNTSFDSAVMPLLDGGDRSTGTGITLHSRQYVIVKNFQIKNYENGLYAWGAQNLTVENIIVKDTGDINAEYSGRGIAFGSEANYNTVKNSIVLNSAAEGIIAVGNSNTIDGCKVYADDNSTLYKSNMDYYIIVAGNNNTISACYAERVGDLDHGGHGIGFKGDCEYNTVINSTAKNLSGGFYVRHRGAKYNIFENCTSIDGDFGLLVRDGASENTFKKCRVTGGWSAVGFFDTSEDDGATWAGSDNIFENCIFENTVRMIDFNDYDRNSDTYDNTFINCDFVGAEYLFSVGRDNHNNEMINCIVQDVQDLKIVTGGYDLNFSYNYIFFWGNGFTTPSGSNITEENPLFENTGSGNYQLKENSPCIDKGTAADAPVDDYDGVARPQGSGYDIGAYEYQASDTDTDTDTDADSDTDTDTDTDADSDTDTDTDTDTDSDSDSDTDTNTDDSGSCNCTVVGKNNRSGLIEILINVL